MSVGMQMGSSGTELKGHTWGTSLLKDSPGITGEKNLVLTSIFASHKSLSSSMVLERWARAVSSFLLRATVARAKAWTTAP